MIAAKYGSNADTFASVNRVKITSSAVCLSKTHSDEWAAVFKTHPASVRNYAPSLLF